MMGLSDAAEREVWQLIERRRLHENLSLCLPVPIRQVACDEGWDLYFREGMGSLYGCAVIDGPDKLMTISADISRPWQRHTIGHEMGHYLNSDSDSIYTFQHSMWLYSKQEWHASLVAAKILIPEAALTAFDTQLEIATVCDVPLDLVHLRIAAAKHLE